MDIIVLAGGISTERDVSLISGSLIAKALKENGHRVILLDVFLGYGSDGDPVDRIFDRADEFSMDVAAISAQAPDIDAVKALRADGGRTFFGPNVLAMCKQCDIVFMGLHGENGENGKVQAVLDLNDIKYTGTGYLGSALAMNKGISRTMYEKAGVPTAAGMTLTKADGRDLPPFGLPCVVKPCSGGSSVGVSIVTNEADYAKALDEGFRYEEELVIEQYISGREFSIGVLEGKALPIIEIAPKNGFYDYKNKYQAGSTVETCPADLSEELTKKMQRFAEMAADCLQLTTYSRTDFMLDQAGNMFCLESNTLPGMTPTSLLPQEAAAIGISYNELCEKLIEISFKKYE